jgi:hypothetical protein
MDGAEIHSGAGDAIPAQEYPQSLPTPTTSTAVGHRRRRRRHSSLSSKLRRSHKMIRLRRVAMWIFLGIAVVATSIYLARTSTAYEPVPTAPGG